MGRCRSALTMRHCLDLRFYCAHNRPAAWIPMIFTKNANVIESHLDLPDIAAFKLRKTLSFCS